MKSNPAHLGLRARSGHDCRIRSAGRRPRRPTRRRADRADVRGADIAVYNEMAKHQLESQGFPQYND